MSSYAELESQILAFIDGDVRAPRSFGELALAIHDFQRANCPALRNYCESVLPAAPERWLDIPPVPTEAFKNAELPIATFPVADAATTFLTSGTSGENRGAHQFRDLRLYDHSIKRAWADLRLPTHPLICLTQPPTVASTSSLVHMLATLGGRFAIGSNGKLDVSRLRTLLAHTRGPIVLAGTALAFLNLFDELTEPLPLPEHSWALETGGYKGSGREISKTELYVMFAAHLHIPTGRVINEYSMTELSSQFYTTGLNQPHRGPRWLRARVLQPGTNTEVADGETGLLAIYDLANLGSSLAVMTRDLANRRGDNFELLGRDPNALPRGCSRAADEMLS